MFSEKFVCHVELSLEPSQAALRISMHQRAKQKQHVHLSKVSACTTQVVCMRPDLPLPEWRPCTHQMLIISCRMLFQAQIARQAGSRTPGMLSCSMRDFKSSVDTLRAIVGEGPAGRFVRPHMEHFFIVLQSLHRDFICMQDDARRAANKKRKATLLSKKLLSDGRGSLPWPR